MVKAGAAALRALFDVHWLLKETVHRRMTTASAPQSVTGDDAKAQRVRDLLSSYYGGNPGAEEASDVVESPIRCHSPNFCAAGSAVNTALSTCCPAGWLATHPVHSCLGQAGACSDTGARLAAGAPRAALRLLRAAWTALALTRTSTWRSCCAARG